MLVALGDRVGPQPLALARQRVRHGRNLAGIGTVELAHQPHDARQSGNVRRNLLLAECKACQAGDVLDVAAIEAHGKGLK